MKQATLLFGGRASESSSKRHDVQDGAVDLKEGEGAAPPSKRVRRAAAQKSQEQTRKQSQMTFGQNGQLCKQKEAADSSIAVDGSDTDDEPVVQSIKRNSIKRSSTEAITKPKEPISMIVKGTQKGPDEATHTFFAKRPATKQLAAGSALALPNHLAPVKQKWQQGKEAPWPDSDNIHVQPVVSERQEGGSLVSITRERKEPTANVRHLNGHQSRDEVFPWHSHSYASSSAVCIEDIENLAEIQSFMKSRTSIVAGDTDEVMAAVPAASIERLRNSPQHGKRSQDGSLWVDQHRPLRAQEVLGNETQAKQLRDWLNRLRVSASDTTSDQSKTRIIRRKQKREKKGALDGFVVDDEEEDQAWYDHFRRAAEPQSELDVGYETEVNDQEATLSNAILLTGPTGSGKTATVYACAAELGFEVFEIYPGQGRRSGKDISQAVGDLGRNHMVSSGGTGGGSTWKGFKAAKIDNGKDVIEGDKKIKTAPRQSLILLEEVDLLFEEDKGFWAAVIELIATSKRPVLMTSTHLYSIPVENMFLQDILHFQPPPLLSAVEYLKVMAQLHGRSVSDDVALSIYTTTAGLGREATRLAEMSMPSSGILDSKADSASIDKSYDGYTTCDLRQAIMQLQYLCQSTGSLDKSSNASHAMNGSIASHEMVGELTSHGYALKNVSKSTELRSYCDCFLTRPVDRELELLEPDEYERVNKADDIQGNDIIALPKVRVKMETSTLAEYGREEEYQSALIGEGALHPPIKSHTRKRVEYSALLLNLMKKLHVSAHHQVPSLAIVTDYAPIVDNMIKVDDVEQQAYQTHLLQAVQEVNSNRQSPNEDDTDSLKTARFSLLQMGIRPSRQSTRMLLERGSDGLLALARKESAPCRWITLEEDLLDKIRQNRIFPTQ